MDFRKKVFLKGFLNQYVKKVLPDLKINEKKLFKCLLNCSNDPSAQILNNHIDCYTPGCKGIGNIYSLVRHLKPIFKSSSEDDIAEYLSHILKVQFPTDGKEILQRYADASFALIPLSQSSKIPLSGNKEWEKTNQKNIQIWYDWFERGYNFGLLLGEVSNCVAVDIDDDPTYEKIKHMLGETLTQTTTRGRHLIYEYDPDFYKTLNKVCRNKGYQCELRTTGAYIVVAPSAVEGEIRTWNDKKIIKMPEELKKFFMEFYKEDIKEEKSIDDTIQNAINSEDAKMDLTGNRNNTFIAWAGVFRKWMDRDTCFKVLNFLSYNAIDKPIPPSELRAIMGQVNKYNTYDKKELGATVLSRLEVIKEASAFQISKSLNLEQKDIEDVLHYLEKEQLIVPIGKNRYRRLEKVQWETDFKSIGEPVDFIVPYFHDYAYFDKGNMIIIGAPTGKGKTHIVANIIKKLVDQGKCPYLISTEASSKVGKVVEKLGVKVGQFYFKIVSSPHNIEFEKDAITIIDWLKPEEGDFSKTDKTYERLNDQLVRKGGFLIVLAQVRKDGTWFAPDQTDFYASLVATYNYRKNGDQLDNKNTFFQTSKIRDSRSGLQNITIPTYFDDVTKILDIKHDKS